MLKKIMLGAALAGMLATPALAQAYYGSMGSGNIVSPNGTPVTAGTPAYVGRSHTAYEHVKSGGGSSAPGFNAFAYQPSGRHPYINDKVYEPGGSYWQYMRER